MLVRRSAHFVAKALLDSRTYAGTEAEADQSAPRSRISLAMCSRAFAAGDLAVLACYGGAGASGLLDTAGEAAGRLQTAVHKSLH